MVHILIMEKQYFVGKKEKNEILRKGMKHPPVIQRLVGG